MDTRYVVQPINPEMRRRGFTGSTHKEVCAAVKAARALHRSCRDPVEIIDQSPGRFERVARVGTDAMGRTWVDVLQAQEPLL